MVLVSALLTVFPLAYSDLPDQLWLGGYLDGGDEDDALYTIQLNLSAVQPPEVEVAPSGGTVQFTPQPGEQVAPSRVLPTKQSRAPPAL